MAKKEGYPRVFSPSFNALIDIELHQFQNDYADQRSQYNWLARRNLVKTEYSFTKESKIQLTKNGKEFIALVKTANPADIEFHLDAGINMKEIYCGNPSPELLKRFKFLDLLDDVWPTRRLESWVDHIAKTDNYRMVYHSQSAGHWDEKWTKFLIHRIPLEDWGIILHKLPETYRTYYAENLRNELAKMGIE